MSLNLLANISNVKRKLLLTLITFAGTTSSSSKGLMKLTIAPILLIA